MFKYRAFKKNIIRTHTHTRKNALEKCNFSDLLTFIILAQQKNKQATKKNIGHTFKVTFRPNVTFPATVK